MQRKAKKKFGQSAFRFGFNSFSTRLIIMGGIFFVSVNIISGRLFGVQVREYQSWKQKAFAQQAQIANIEPERGDIYVRNKDGGLQAVAVSKRFFEIGVDPRKAGERLRQDAQTLAEALSLDVSAVAEKLAKRNDPYETLAKHVPEEVAARIQGKNIPSLVMTEHRERYYPLGNFASHIIGFVGYDSEGKSAGRYGIELGQDGALRGSGLSADELRTLMDKGSLWGAKSFYVQNGAQIVLTLDPNIQSEAEKDLAEEVRQWNAKSGNVIVMDPKTGAILALANYPSFDPNTYAKEKNLSVFLNSAVSLRYEPGSVFKPFTLAAGLTSGKITPQSSYYDSGEQIIGNVKIHNAGNSAPRKMIDMALFLQRSYNLGAVFIERTIGNQAFRDFVLKTLRFGDKTGIDVPQEIANSFGNLDGKYANDVNYAEASFGQGIAVTPIKLIQMFAAFANSGIVMQPYVVDTVQFPDGTRKTTTPRIIGQMIDRNVVAQEVPLLEGVVEAKLGSGRPARVAGYRIAGKTGTADIASSDGSGYSGSVNHTFVGFGPTTDPKFVILTRIEEPKGVRYAEATAVPLAGKIMKYLVNYYGIPPDKPEDLTQQ